MEDSQGEATLGLFLRFRGKRTPCTLNKQWPTWLTRSWHVRRRLVQDGAESRTGTRLAPFFAPRLVGSYRSCAMGYMAPRERTSGKRTFREREQTSVGRPDERSVGTPNTRSVAEPSSPFGSRSCRR